MQKGRFKSASSFDQKIVVPFCPESKLSGIENTYMEGQINGLMIYDRKVIKLDENRIHEMNQKISKVLNEK